MESNDKHILEIAHAVRDWCEQHVRRTPFYDFYQSKALDCMCAYASTVLMGCLTHFGVSGATLHVSNYHVYLSVNHKVLDITATQFRTRSDSESHRVEYVPMSSILARYPDADFWEEEHRCSSVEDAFQALNPGSAAGFPEEQYWERRSRMWQTIHSAIRFCERRNIVPLQRLAA